jgi:hypothetical protein
MGNLNPKYEDVEANKKKAKFQQAPPPHVARDRDASYYAKDLDGYSKIRVRVAGDIQSTKLDHDLMMAMRHCLIDDGKIDVNEVKNQIIKYVADGRHGKSELTCNERWSLRYGMGEFEWEFEARKLLLNEIAKMDVLDTADKKLENPEEIEKALFGPSLGELEQAAKPSAEAAEPPAKRCKVAEDKSGNLIYVDGMKLDRDMLLAAKQATQDDQIIDAREAVKIFMAAADEDNVLTRCERWTLRFILSTCVFTDAAFNFLKEALSKLEQTDDHGAN